MNNEISQRDRFLGCLLGLACGDAVGTSVEFSARGSFQPLTDMVGGGPFSLVAGQWTDDTSMALCLADSLLSKGGFDAYDQMSRYSNWQKWGYLSATGNCFDIGMTVASALERFRASGNPYSGSTEPNTAGNGALMRLAPVVMFYFPDTATAIARACDSTRTTHAAPEAIDCSGLFSAILCQALAGKSKQEILFHHGYRATEENVLAIAEGNYARKAIHEVAGTGYCIASLEAALWCFLTTESFSAAILQAANLGDDADTTAAITGQIAGAHYGVGAIEASWLERLAMRRDIETYAEQLWLQKPDTMLAI